MIPILLLISGALVILYGLYNIAKSQLQVNQRSINGQGELLENAKLRRKDQLRISLSVVMIGLLICVAGYYLGFSEKGNGFWLHRLVAGSESTEDDMLTKNGEFKSQSGSTYKYYIMVSGNSIKFCGREIADVTEIAEDLKSHRGSPVIIVDNYGSASAVMTVTELLKENGISYEMETIV